MTPVLSLAPSPLPRPVKPFPAETLASYLNRLAHANRLNAQSLRRYIAEGQPSGIVPVNRLAAVSGTTAIALEQAIADLDRRRLAGTYYNRTIAIHPEVNAPACQLCTAARGIDQPVTCRQSAEKVICLRHRRWTNPGSTGIQPSLDRQLDILKAHRRHLRLVRRFGRNEATLGFAIAAEICRHWRDQREHDEEFNRRLAIFHGDDWRLSPADPTVAAAAYPEVVALARLLISPYWQSLAVTYSANGRSLFQQETRRTVAPGYHLPPPRFSQDPLHRWITGDKRRSSYDEIAG